MNLDELKPLWQEYDRKIKNSSSLNEKLISSMIRERSGQRLARFKKEHHFFLLLMIVWIVCFSAVIIGNPFDFLYVVQYIPSALLLCWSAITFVRLLNAYKLFRINFTDPDLQRSLQNLVRMYGKYGKTPSWIIFLMMSAGLLFSFSFLPAKIITKGVWIAIGESLLASAIAFLIYFAAYKMGAFKDRYEDKFRQDLYELEELKAMVNELE